MAQVAKTVQDFGAQWTRFTDNSGYYGSLDLLSDIIEPVMTVFELRGKHVAEIGSGTGRIANMLLDAEVASLTAVEPSDAFRVLVKNTAPRKDRVRYVHATGDQLPSDPALDIVFSIGVLHHIEDPDPAVKAAYAALKPGGEVVFWLYGHEGNEIYVTLVKMLRSFSTILPDKALEWLSIALDRMLDPYVFLCRFLPLPMRQYFLGHYGKLSRSKRQLTVFDQLNPDYAKYYRRHEAEELLTRNGFKCVAVHHRHGYSWTVRGKKV